MSDRIQPLSCTQETTTPLHLTTLSDIINVSDCTAGTQGCHNSYDCKNYVIENASAGYSRVCWLDKNRTTCYISSCVQGTWLVHSSM